MTNQTTNPSGSYPETLKNSLLFTTLHGVLLRHLTSTRELQGQLEALNDEAQTEDEDALVYEASSIIRTYTGNLRDLTDNMTEASAWVKFTNLSPA